MSTRTVSNPAVHQHQRSPAPPARRFAVAAFVLGVAIGYRLGHSRTRVLRRQLAWQRHAARHDPLTGLPNRAVVYDLLDHTNPALVGLCDLDQLKTVNDHHGHHAGDQLLRLAAPAGPRSSAAERRTPGPPSAGQGSRRRSSSPLPPLARGSPSPLTVVAPLPGDHDRRSPPREGRSQYLHGMRAAAAANAAGGPATRSWRCCVRRARAQVGQQLLHIPIRQAVPEVPTRRHRDHLGCEPEAGEGRPVRDPTGPASTHPHSLPHHPPDAEMISQRNTAAQRPDRAARPCSSAGRSRMCRDHFRLR